MVEVKDIHEEFENEKDEKNLTSEFQLFSGPQFEFLWKVRVMRSNLGKEVKISRL